MKGSAYKLLLFCFVVLAVSSCLKRKYHLLEVNSDMVMRYSYQPGTYWVMRDSATGRTDSFYVMADSVVTRPGREKLDIQHYYCSIQQVNQQHTDSCLWQIHMVQNSFILNVSPTDSEYLYVCGAMHYPFPLSYALYPMNARYYADVYESNYYQFAADGTTMLYNNWLYLNEREGLVKMRLNLYNPERHFVWELQRMKLVL